MAKDATQDRVQEIRDEAHAIALALAGHAEALLSASNRLREATIQAHFYAVAQISAAEKQIPQLKERAKANNLRWSFHD